MVPPGDPKTKEDKNDQIKSENNIVIVFDAQDVVYKKFVPSRQPIDTANYHADVFERFEQNVFRVQGGRLYLAAPSWQCFQSHRPVSQRVACKAQFGNAFPVLKYPDLITAVFFYFRGLVPPSKVTIQKALRRSKSHCRPLWTNFSSRPSRTRTMPGKIAGKNVQTHEGGFSKISEHLLQYLEHILFWDNTCFTL